MKYIKTFEVKEEDQEDVFNSATLYLEESQPISKEDGFIECLYSFYGGFADRNANIDFYFKDTLTDENLEKFYKYLKTNRFKIKSENFNYQYKTYGEPLIDAIEITINLTLYRAEKFAEIYDSAIKYNL